MLLLGIMIYLTMPNYISKGKIVFPCILGESVTKTIELRNPTKHAIQYIVIREGHPDFAFEEKKILIDSRKVVAFPITFNSRISNPVMGKIIFANSKEEGT